MTISTPELDTLEAEPGGRNGTTLPASLAPYPSGTVANWTLFVFALSLVVNFLDRGIINLLVQPIKRDLHLSDFRVSLLMGPAFVIFYLLLGLPIARLADSGSRRTIVGVGLACWSLMTGACGLAQGFSSFFAARVGVGVGDACTGPATYSMVSDLFPRERLPRAMALMQLGATAGLGLAMLIGAAAIQLLSKAPDIVVPMIGVIRNWQMVFFVVGLPGLLVAALMMTVPEPTRRGFVGGRAATAVPVSQVARYLGEHWQVYLPFFLAVGLGVLNTSAGQSWGPTFYQRTFGWSPQKTAVFLGLGAIILTPTGLLVGTGLVEWYQRRGFGDANLRLVRWTTLLALPFSIVSPLAPTPWLALTAYFTSVLMVALGTSAQNAALQTITPNPMRGRVTALFLLTYSLCSGLGPSLVALLTDRVLNNEAHIGVSISMVAGTVLPLQVICYWLALKPYGRSVALAMSWS